MTNPNFAPAVTELVEQLKIMYAGWDGVKQFTDTPGRLSRLYQERCWSPERIQKELDETIRVFDDDYKEMVIAGPAIVWVLCPHHLLPCELQVVMGVLPKGKVLGASKFTRIADTLGRRPIMQETYTTELVEFLQSKLDPRGAAVHVIGSHSCMTSRGIRQPRENRMITNAVRGDFLNDKSAKDEFFQSVGLRYSK